MGLHRPRVFAKVPGWRLWIGHLERRQVYNNTPNHLFNANTYAVENTITIEW